MELDFNDQNNSFCLGHTDAEANLQDPYGNFTTRPVKRYSEGNDREKTLLQALPIYS